MWGMKEKKKKLRKGALVYHPGTIPIRFPGDVQSFFRQAGHTEPYSYGSQLS